MVIPTTWIEAPPRAPRPNTSLDVVPVHDVSNEHFVGFEFQPDPCGFPKALPQGCYVQYGPTSDTEKGFDDPGNSVVTDVFGVYQGIECYLNGGPDSFREIAGRILTAGEHRIVDGRIAGLLSGSTPTTPATAATIEGAIGLLEQYLALEIPGQGYLYMGPLAATFAASKHLIIREPDGTLITNLGTPVVVLTEPSSAGFIYASGPINIWRGPVITTDTTSWTINTAQALAERLYSVAIECGAWKVAFAPPIAGGEEGPGSGDALTLNLGSSPSSPIPAGTDVTITVNTNVAPSDEVYLWYSINGDPSVDAGEMTQTGTLEFVWEAQGGLVAAGDSVEIWAASQYAGDYVESNHITIDVT